MEAKRVLVRSYVAQGLNLDICLSMTQLPRSTYYYRPTGLPKGKKPSTHTIYRGNPVTNGQVVKRIKSILAQPFIDYGYKKVTPVLKELGYEIGKSKVYRLMKINSLLHPSIKPKPRSFRNRVWTSPQPNGPLEILEMDIKYVWINGLNRYAYLVTIFDTFNLQALSWVLNLNMKTKQVKQVIAKMIDTQLIPKTIDPKKIELYMRTDNGSQFRSEEYLTMLNEIGIQTQYIPKATPQLNGHIEGFHSLISKLVCNKIEFQSLEHARTIFRSFFKVYNEKRIISTLVNKSPVHFTLLWQQNKVGMKMKNGKRIYFLKGEDPKMSLHPSRLL